MISRLMSHCRAPRDVEATQHCSNREIDKKSQTLTAAWSMRAIIYLRRQPGVCKHNVVEDEMRKYNQLVTIGLKKAPHKSVHTSLG